MNHRYVLAAVLLSCNCTAAWSPTDEQLVGYANCQAWSSALGSATPSTPLPDEWNVWALAVVAMAVATFNDEWHPLKDNPKFREALRSIRASLELVPLSADSSSYQKAYAICMRHVQALSEAWKAKK
jgi:hypothetical protein